MTQKQPDTNRGVSLMKRIDDKIAIWQSIKDFDGEVAPFVENWLNDVETSISTKVDSYKFTQEELDLEAERLREEARRIITAARTVEAISEALTSRIKIAMVKLGTDEISGERYRFRLTNVKPELVIDKSKLPPEFLIQITSSEPDKERIRALLTIGESVPGAHLEESKALRSYVMKGGK